MGLTDGTQGMAASNMHVYILHNISTSEHSIVVNHVHACVRLTTYFPKKVIMFSSMQLVAIKR